MMEGLKRDASRVLGNYVREIVQETASSNEFVPPARVLFLITVKSGYIVGGTNLSIAYFEENTKTIPSNLEFQNKNTGVFSNCKFGPTKAIRLSVILVERVNKVY